MLTYSDELAELLHKLDFISFRNGENWNPTDMINQGENYILIFTYGKHVLFKSHFQVILLDIIKLYYPNATIITQNYNDDIYIRIYNMSEENAMTN